MFKINYKKHGDWDVLSKGEFATFNPTILEVGDLAAEGTVSQGVAAIFDLEGFTDFCNQIDPHLVVPEFLGDFLQWLFGSIATELKHSEEKDNVLLWCKFPFFAKFLGDGVLFIWDSSKMTKEDHANLVISLFEVCKTYRSEYFPRASKMFSKVPPRIRCGIARGQIIAIGDGRDYVGACINVAARLQKLANLSFAFSRRGFDLKSQFVQDWWDIFLLIEVSIRGVGAKELVYVTKTEFESLSDDDRKRLVDT